MPAVAPAGLLSHATPDCHPILAATIFLHASLVCINHTDLMVKYHPAPLGLTEDWGGAIRCWSTYSSLFFFLPHFFPGQIILFVLHIRSSTSDFVTFWICHLSSYSGARLGQLRELGIQYFMGFYLHHNLKGTLVKARQKWQTLCQCCHLNPVILQNFSIDDFLHIFSIENVIPQNHFYRLIVYNFRSGISQRSTGPLY